MVVKIFSLLLSAHLALASMFPFAFWKNKPFIVATGCTITTSGSYKKHTCTAGTTFTVSAAPAGQTLEYLVVGGGGAGGGMTPVAAAVAPGA